MSLIVRTARALAAVRHSDAVSPYMESLKHDLTPHLPKRLRRRLRMLMFISSILLLTAAYDVAAHHIGIALALLAGGVGLGIGLLMGRISLFSWDAEKAQVTAKMDVVGAGLLFLYILIVLQRREILGHWLTADALAAASLAMAGGTLMGRNLATRKRISALLMQVGLIPSSTTRSNGMEAAL
jgi:hypothetical protein